MSQSFVDHRALVGVSIAWIGALTLVPPLADQRWAFAMTAAFIAMNAVCSLWMITRRRRVLVALNCVQIALFGFLNFQLCQAFGEEHYRFDQQPRFYDWIEFTAAHVVRAADVIDALDQFGIHIRRIAHESNAASLILVCMHLTVDVFLVGLILRWISRMRQGAASETRLEKGRREFGWLLVTFALFVVFAVSQRMQPLDWLLWPVDNLIRLIDVGDVMEIYGWSLHGVEPTYWTKGAGLFFRLCAGVWMARLINLWRITVFRTWGLSIDELTELLDDTDAQMRRGAVEGLGLSGPDAKPAVPRLIEAMRDYDASVRRMTAWALGQIGPAAADATACLVESIWRQDRELRLAALEALRRIGPDARSSVHDLVFLLKAGDAETRRAAARALDGIAPGVRQSLRTEVCVIQKPTKRKSRRKAKRKQNWQRCVEAALVRRTKEMIIDTHLRSLLTQGYFAEPRNAKTLREVLAARGEVVERNLLFMPLLRLTSEQKLSRSLNDAGSWVYLEIVSCSSEAASA